MRVLLTAGSTARLHTLVPLVWALRSAGSDVKVAGRPALVDTILRTGSVAVRIGGDAPPDGGWLADKSDVDDLAEFAKAWRPDVVVADERALAGAVAARVSGALAVRMVGAADQSPRAADEAGTAEVSGRIGTGLSAHGVTLDEALVVGDATFDSLPPSLRLSADRNGNRPVRFVPYSGPGVVPVWLRRKVRRKRVWLSLSEPRSLAAVFDAVGGLDVEVVYTASAAGFDAGTRVPVNIRLVDSAPALALLSTCSAVVHGDDAGTALTALAQGLPQLSLSAGAASGLATRIADAGAGLTAQLPGSALTEQIQALVADESLRARAEGLRAEIATTPGPHELAAEVANLVSSR